MNDISESRPDFFEGEYLDASDLQQIVAYFRDQSARHQLAGHAWGINAGLQLVEQQNPSGGLDVFLLPGTAVDGYGRTITVLAPFRLTIDLFAGQPSGNVPIWVRYDEGPAQGVRPGFQVCSASDSYSRVDESYAVEVGRFTLSDQQGGVTLGGDLIADARAAPQHYDDTAPIACDSSVPFQELPPQSGHDRWLVPVGIVSYKAGSPGQLLARTEAQRLLSRRQRRNLGVVAENVLAADGVIRLRDRFTHPAAGATNDETCAAGMLQDGDVLVCNDEVHAAELIWLEGDVRVTGDLRLFGTRLELRGQDGAAPVGGPTALALQRNEKNDVGGQSLEVLLGKSTKGQNRLDVVQVDPKAGADACTTDYSKKQTLMVVQDDGKVGIGTTHPDQAVTIEAADQVFLSLKASGAIEHELKLGADKDGAVIAAEDGDDLLLQTGGDKTRLAVKADGKVGINTTAPDALLTLEAQSTVSLTARTIDGPHEVALGADGDGAFLSAQSDDDLQLRAGGGATKAIVKKSGRVGIGTTDPGEMLVVASPGAARVEVHATSGGLHMFLSADSQGTRLMASDSLRLVAGNHTGLVVDAGNGRVGLGTDAPGATLDVRGNIHLGTSGELSAAASVRALLFLIGWVQADGSRYQGNGYAPIRVDTGQYYVQFDTPYPTMPVVVASAIDSVADDNILTLKGVSQAGFGISFVNRTGGYEDTAFSFQVASFR